MTAILLTFPTRAIRPQPASAADETRAYHLGQLSEAACAAQDAISDIAEATRALFSGKLLRETDAVLSGETIGSFASATLRMIDLRGRAADLELRRSLVRWLEENGGADD